MYSDRRGNRQLKTTPDKTFQTKDPFTKPPEREFVGYMGLLSGICNCTRPTKNRGSEMCGVLMGVPRCVAKCDRRMGQNLPKIRILYRPNLWTACHGHI